MVYVFDSNSFGVISYYFPERFPSFWKSFNGLVADGRILSVREVYLELENRLPENRQHMLNWIVANRNVFLVPGPEETKFVSQIFAVSHFQQLVKTKQTLIGSPVADPFIIASAKIRNGCVVTEEGKKDNSARIPNVCDHFAVACINVEKFMERESMQF